MQNDEFLINELAKLAQVTPRTIRYYTDEGLLPPPNTHGKYAYYTTEHLNRLKLILRMKETYLPLREIRMAVTALTDAEIDQQLQPPSPVPAPDPQTPVRPNSVGESALDYIAQLTSRQADVRSRYQSAPPPPQPTSPSPRPETWQRIQLAPGVELHLREPISGPTAAIVSQVQQLAHQLFREKEK